MAKDNGTGRDGWVTASVVSPLFLIDRLTTEGGVVVMVEAGPAHRVVRLSDLGREVVDAVGAGTTLGGLESSMLERVGPPPNGDLSAAVHAAVAMLVDAGVLTVTPSGPDVMKS